MELFFTDLRSLTRTIPFAGNDRFADNIASRLPAGAIDAIAKMAIPNGMPFFPDESGHYEPVLSKFFRDLAADGRRSDRTRTAYARDIHLFCRFLNERRDGKEILAATKEDLRAYYRVRRLSNKNPIGERGWNRAIAALDRFYRCASSEGLVSGLPFDYRYATAKLPGHEQSLPTCARRCGPCEPKCGPCEPKLPPSFLAAALASKAKLMQRASSYPNGSTSCDEPLSTTTRLWSAKWHSSRNVA